MAQRNQDSFKLNKTLRLGVNQYSDLTLDEFIKTRGGLFEINEKHMRDVPDK